MAWIINQEILRRWGPVVALFLVVVLGVLGRVMTPFPFVFPESGETRLLGMDPYFYLRHAETTTSNFPHLQKFDHATHYPTGSTADATGLFTLLIAGPAFVLGAGDPGPELVARVAAWLPPVLSIIIFLLLYGLGRTLYDQWTGVGMAFLFFLYPGYSLHRSLLGFADQHVAEILLSVWLAYGLVRCLKRSDNPRRLPWMPSLTNSLPLVLFYALWPGAPLYLALVGAVLLVYITLEIPHANNLKPLAWAVFRYAVGAGIGLALLWMLFPNVLTVMNEQMIRLSLLALFGLGAGIVGCLYAAEKLIHRGVLAWKVSLVLFGGVLLLVMALYWLVPQIAWSIDFLFNRPGDTLIENQPVSWRLVWQLLGPALFLFALGLLFGVYKSFQDASARLAMIPLALGGLLLFLWWKTNDFEYLPPPFIAIGATLGVRWVGEAISRALESRKKQARKSKKRPAKESGPRVLWWLGLIATLILVVPMWPLEVVSKPFISTRATDQAMYYTEAWMETTDWLRNETPEPSLSVNEIVPEEARGENGFVYPEDTYGIMTAWDYGNLVAQRGRRIPVWSRYPAAPPAQWMTATSETESLELLCPDCDESERVRYVIVDSKMAGPLFLTKARVAGKDVGAYGISDGGWNIRGQDVTRRLYGPLYDNSITARLYNRNGEGLSHYRLVFESSEESFLTYQTETTTRIEQYPIRDAEQKAQFEEFVRRGVVASPQGIVHDGWITSTVKIFEVVKGSVIAGTEQPGSEIRAELMLESEASARQIPYTATALAGPGGTFEIRVPYATSRGPSTSITPKGPYRLYRIVEADTTLIGTVDISDAQINEGATVWLAR